MMYKLQQISDPKSCLNIFRSVLQEKMSQADSQTMAASKEAIDAIFSSLKYWEQNLRDLEHVSWELYPLLVRAYSSLNGFKTKRSEQFLQHGFTHWSHDGLRVKLYALHGILFVAQTHD